MMVVLAILPNLTHNYSWRRRIFFHSLGRQLSHTHDISPIDPKTRLNAVSNVSVCYSEGCSRKLNPTIPSAITTSGPDPDLDDTDTRLPIMPLFPTSNESGELSGNST